MMPIPRPRLIDVGHGHADPPLAGGRRGEVPSYRGARNVFASGETAVAKPNESALRAVDIAFISATGLFCLGFDVSARDIFDRPDLAADRARE